LCLEEIPDRSMREIGFSITGELLGIVPPSVKAGLEILIDMLPLL
jgi:hypothetical protein